MIQQQSSVQASPAGGPWFNLSEVATVEVSSEATGFAVESVFTPEAGGGWRADQVGEQTLRLVFDQPTHVRLIHLSFIETEVERTQEFLLSWAGADGQLRDVARQQYTFSPGGSTRQEENYTVDLGGVYILQLSIKPDLEPGRAVASLARWRVA